MSENISLDVRFGSRSYYSDYGIFLRLFDCVGYEAMVKLCYGAGAGATYSTGLVTDASNRTFTDMQIEPFVRFIFDSQHDVGIIAEGGVKTILNRSYSTATPYRSDSRVKFRPYVAVGLLFDWEKIEDPTTFSMDNFEEVVPESYPSVLLGVKGGLGNAKFLTVDAAGNTQAGSTYREGILGGISLDVGQGKWGFQLDGFYANRRMGSSATTTTVIERFEVFPQLRFRTLGSNFLLLTGGGFGAIALGKSITTANGVSLGEADGVFDYGASLGFGFGTRSKILTLTMEVRASWGFADFNPVAIPKASTRSRMLDLLIGFVF